MFAFFEIYLAVNIPVDQLKTHSEKAGLELEHNFISVHLLVCA